MRQQPHVSEKLTTGDPASERVALEDVRQVTLVWQGGGATRSYLMLAAEVDTFVEATKRLHWKPGINPHNGGETSKVWRITVATLQFGGPFWWTVPDLQNNDDPRGARIIDAGYGRLVFEDEEYTFRLKAQEAEADAAYYREKEREAASEAPGSPVVSETGNEEVMVPE